MAKGSVLGALLLGRARPAGRDDEGPDFSDVASRMLDAIRDKNEDALAEALKAYHQECHDSCPDCSGKAENTESEGDAEL
jgi:hypothetical protein